MLEESLSNFSMARPQKQKKLVGHGLPKTVKMGLKKIQSMEIILSSNNSLADDFSD